MITIRTAAERPDLWKISNGAPAVWPEYNMHGDVVNQWWGLLDEELPQFQFVLYDDEAGSVAARGLTGPSRGTARTRRCPTVSTRLSSRSSPSIARTNPSAPSAR
jgi:hypothetical protein